MSKVMVFGSFDMVHPGHLYVFSEAKKKADELIVVVARDKTIEEIKGRMPRFSEDKRVSHIREIPIVDEVILGSLEDKYEMIRKIKPDIICLGHDQVVFTEKLQKFLDKSNLDIDVCRLKAYKRHLYSSSRMKDLEDNEK